MTALRRRASRRLSWAQVRRCFLALPGVVEGSSYGTPAFRVGKKLLARQASDLPRIAELAGCTVAPRGVVAKWEVERR
jgi:hypothetical protein